jgi:hypothetical protein
MLQLKELSETTPASLLPNWDRAIITLALLAKNNGAGINYFAVCSYLGALPESMVAGLCVNNIMVLFYFPLASLLASVYQDCDNDDNDPNPCGGEDGADQEDGVDIVDGGEGKCDDPSSLI